jgi:hypothetical protein
VEDLCKPHPFADRLNLKPTPTFDLLVRAGKVIVHLWVGEGEQILFDGSRLWSHALQRRKAPELQLAETRRVQENSTRKTAQLTHTIDIFELARRPHETIISFRTRNTQGYQIQFQSHIPFAGRLVLINCPNASMVFSEQSLRNINLLSDVTQHSARMLPGMMFPT